MNILKVFAIVALFSCNGKNSQLPQARQPDKVWTLTNQEFITNTYTTGGLLDTSFSTIVTYEEGTITHTIKSMTVRRYKNNKLIREMDFNLSGEGIATKLLNETIKEYDAAGNSIRDVREIDGFTISKEADVYNSKRQVIKRIMLSRGLPSVSQKPDDAQSSDPGAKELCYDTTLINYQYDANGNLVRALIYNANGNLQKKHINVYQGLIEKFSFDITPAGDTVSKFRYEYSGDIIKEFAVTSQPSGVDTIWKQGGRILMIISHDGKRGKIKKVVIKRNSKGDESESSSYDQDQ